MARKVNTPKRDNEDDHQRDPLWKRLSRTLGKPFRDNNNDDDDKPQRVSKSERGFSKDDGERVVVHHGGGTLNSQYKGMGSPSGWGKPSDDLKEASPYKITYQEQRGRNGASFGTIRIADANGVVHYFPAVSGPNGQGSIPGTGNGTGEVDVRYGGVVREMTVSNFRAHRDDKPTFGVRDNGRKVNFSLDISDPTGTHRDDFRIHPDGGKAGTIGCLGIPPQHAAEFERVLSSLDKAGRLDGMKFAILPSEDRGNKYATHFHEHDNRHEKVKKLANEYKERPHNHDEPETGRNPTHVARNNTRIRSGRDS